MLKQKKGRTPGDPPTIKVENSQGILKTVKEGKHLRILGANIQGNLLWASHLETGDRALFPQVRKLLGRLKHVGKQIPMEK